MNGARAVWSKTLEHLDREAFRLARKEFHRILAGRKMPNADTHDAELIFGELLANACEHGKLPIHIDLSEKDGQYVLRVADAGTGVARRAHATAPPPDAIRGRGFNLIERLGGIIHIERPPVSAVTVGLPLRTSQ